MKNNPAMSFFGGIAAFVFGFIIIRLFNVWDTPAQIILSIIGWMAFVKGIFLILLPELTEKLIGFFAQRKMILPVGILSFVLALAIGYVAYFM